MYRNRIFRISPIYLQQNDVYLDLDRIIYFAERGIWKPEVLCMTEIINMVKNIVIENKKNEKNEKNEKKRKI